MVVRGELFRQFGFFDTVFSPGYGEENDFSMRIRRGGWRVALANRALAFHVGGASFGRDSAAELQLRNEIVFRRRYPRFTFDREMYLVNGTGSSRESRLVIKSLALGVAIAKTIVFAVLGLAPRNAARLVLAIRQPLLWFRR
jgi:GT2 family glycosyltransferase